MISSRSFAPLMRSALAEGQALMLPVPASESLEAASTDILDVDLDEPSESDIALLERGGRCDKRHYTKLWHALVRDTSLASKEGRGAFLDDMSDQRYDSLSLFLDQASESDAALLIECARDYLVERGELTAADDVDDDSDTPARPRFTGDDYERTYGAAYAEEDAQKPSQSAEKSAKRVKLEDGYAKLLDIAREAGVEMPALDFEWTDDELEVTGKHWRDHLVGQQRKSQVSGE